MSAEEPAVEHRVSTRSSPALADGEREALARRALPLTKLCPDDLPDSSPEIATPKGHPEPGVAGRSIGGMLRNQLAVHGGAFYAFLARLWASALWLGLIALAVVRLSPEVQGYFFTFSSLLLLQVFFELGFGVVLLQFVSHEWAFLRFGPNRQIEGSPAAAARLASLVRLGIRWYAVVALALFVLLGAGGHLFFASSSATGVAWVTPWWLLVTAQACSALIVPQSAFLEGSGQVALNQRNLLIANVCAGLAAGTALLLGGELYAIVLLVGVRATVAHALILPAALPFLRLWPLRSADDRIDWFHQFWPLQWRIGLSWTSGFLMFQSFTPVAFYVQGASVAGQVGVIVQAFHAVNQLGSCWLTAVQPRMGHLAARGNLPALRLLVRDTLRRSFVTALLLAIAAFTLIAGVKHFVPHYGARFGDLMAAGVFLAVAVSLQLANVETAAVRFRKREPFVPVSFAAAATVLGSNLLLGHAFGIRGMALGFAAAILLLTLPWVHRLFHRNMEDPATEPLS